MLAKIKEAEEVLNEYGARSALRFASKLKCLGKYRDDIQKAYSAICHPNFYEGTGQSPNELINKGLDALKKLIEEQKLDAPQ